MIVISRSQWGARAPLNRTALKSSTGITIHYEGPKMGDYKHESCPAKVRGIQAFHMDTRKWSDVAYSDIVCIHGYVYECRGLGVRTAAQGTNEGNNKHHAICAMMGADDPQPEVMKQAIRERADWYSSQGVGTERVPHRFWHATSCPGDPLAEWVAAGLPVTAAPIPAPAPVQPGLPATHEWMAYDPSFTGGVDVAGLEVGGKSYVAVGAGPGGGPHLRIFTADGTEVAGVFPFPVAFNGGLWIGGGDIDGDGNDELAVGAGPGGGPHIKVYKFDGKALTEIASFMGWAGWTGGVRPSLAKGIVTAAVGPGGGPHTKVWDKAAVGL